MKDIINESNEYILKTYNRFNIVFEKGKGVYLYDTNKKKYLDFVSGIAVNSLGYNDKGLNKVLKKQAKKLFHISNLYYSKPLLKASKILVSNSDFDKVFFCNSGAESVEAALKLARMYASKFKNGENKIIAMDNSFHGRTFGAISATGQKKYTDNLGDLLPHVKHVPFLDFEALEKEARNDTCAIILEPIQGEGGIIPATKEYLKKVRKLANDLDIVLIFDEVQCGIGRTGELFAYQYYGVIPDVLCLAKGIAGGFPCGAILVNKEKTKAFEPGNHASTFGGNPLAMSALYYTIDKILNDNILNNVKKSSQTLKDGLIELKNKYSFIKDIRGVGLMYGVEFDFPVNDIITKAMEDGLLLLNSGANVLRFVPPLTISEEEIKIGLGKLSKIFENI